MFIQPRRQTRVYRNRKKFIISSRRSLAVSSTRLRGEVAPECLSLILKANIHFSLSVSSVCEGITKSGANHNDRENVHELISSKHGLAHTRTLFSLFSLTLYPRPLYSKPFVLHPPPINQTDSVFASITDLVFCFHHFVCQIYSTKISIRLVMLYNTEN